MRITLILEDPLMKRLETKNLMVNGQSLAHCHGIVKEAMDKCWKDKSKDGKVTGEWHFDKKSVLKKQRSLEDNLIE